MIIEFILHENEPSWSKQIQRWLDRIQIKISWLEENIEESNIKSLSNIQILCQGKTNQWKYLGRQQYNDITSDHLVIWFDIKDEAQAVLFKLRF